MSAETGASGTEREGDGQQGRGQSPATAGVENAAPQVPEGQADRAKVKRVLEALLFSSDRPITTARLAELSGADDGRQAREVVRELQREYDAEGRAFCVEEIAGGFQLLTRPEFAAHVSRLHSRQDQETLSKAALETLAIVAYRQPITRAAVEDIRGVQSGHILRALVEKRLLKVAGRSEELGRPLLYATTRYFLEAFGLRSLDDLPKRAEFGPAPGRQRGADAAAQPDQSAPTPAEPDQDAAAADQDQDAAAARQDAAAADQDGAAEGEAQ
jgi:segregation and condensation protein B